MEPYDFETWINEDGLRTSLGPYPPAYGAAQYPPQYFMPMAAGALGKMITWHPEMLNKPEAKKSSSEPKKKSTPKKKKKAKAKPKKK